MKFDMHAPCKECPFLKGSATNRTLSPARIEGIIDDLRDDMHFICHKTLENEPKNQQHCGGALIFLEREDRPNQMMRIAERIGLYDRRKLNMDADVI